MDQTGARVEVGRDNSGEFKNELWEKMRGFYMLIIEKSRKEEIVQLHGKFAESFKRTLDHGIRIGQLLTEQKADLNHGEFGLWIERNIPFSSRTARNYMKLFRNRDALKTETVSDFKSAYRLLEAPKEQGPKENESNFSYMLRRAKELRIGLIMEPYMKAYNFDCETICGQTEGWGCLKEIVRQVGYKNMHPNLQAFYDELVERGRKEDEKGNL